MTKKLTDYEIDKQIKKQLLVRNEFLYHGNSMGKYSFPVIRKQNIDVEKIKFLSYTNTKKMMSTIRTKPFTFLHMIGNLKMFMKIQMKNWKN